jgi:hypothetical protein
VIRRARGSSPTPDTLCFVGEAFDPLRLVGNIAEYRRSVSVVRSFSRHTSSEVSHQASDAPWKRLLKKPGLYCDASFQRVLKKLGSYCDASFQGASNGPDKGPRTGSAPQAAHRRHAARCFFDDLFQGASNGCGNGSTTGSARQAAPQRDAAHCFFNTLWKDASECNPGPFQ